MQLEIKSLYKNFFDFVIWDVIKPLFSGLSINIPYNELKKSIGKVFVEGALHYKVNYDNILEILKKSNLPIAIIDYIIDLLSKFANQLDSYFLKNVNDINSVYKGKELENILHDFNNIINEYILISYFDLIVLKQATSLLVYASDLSLADIYQCRMEFTELLRSALVKDSSLIIAELLESIREKLSSITDNEKIINLIMIQLASFFEWLVSSDDFNTIIPIMKEILSHEVINYHQVSSLIPSNNINIITEWFKQQVIEIPIILLQKSLSNDFTYECENLKHDILEIFKLFINGTITYDILEKRLQDIGKKLGLEKIYKIEENIFEFLELDQSLDLVKSYPLQEIRTKFNFNLPKFQKRENDQKYIEQVNLIILYQIYNNSLTYCKFIEEEKAIDPSLKRLIQYIKSKIQISETLYI